MAVRSSDERGTDARTNSTLCLLRDGCRSHLAPHLAPRSGLGAQGSHIDLSPRRVRHLPAPGGRRVRLRSVHQKAEEWCLSRSGLPDLTTTSDWLWHDSGNELPWKSAGKTPGLASSSAISTAVAVASSAEDAPPSSTCTTSFRAQRAERTRTTTCSCSAIAITRCWSPSAARSSRAASRCGRSARTTTRMSRAVACARRSSTEQLDIWWLADRFPERRKPRPGRLMLLRLAVGGTRKSVGVEDEREMRVRRIHFSTSS